jgi:hypothetical protein
MGLYFSVQRLSTGADAEFNGIYLAICKIRKADSERRGCCRRVVGTACTAIKLITPSKKKSWAIEPTRPVAESWTGGFPRHALNAQPSHVRHHRPPLGSPLPSPRWPVVAAEVVAWSREWNPARFNGELGGSRPRQRPCWLFLPSKPQNTWPPTAGALLPCEPNLPFRAVSLPQPSHSSRHRGGGGGRKAGISPFACAPGEQLRPPPPPPPRRLPIRARQPRPGGAAAEDLPPAAWPRPLPALAVGSQRR